jgi:hypothetical protein
MILSLHLITSIIMQFHLNYDNSSLTLSPSYKPSSPTSATMPTSNVLLLHPYQKESSMMWTRPSKNKAISDTALHKLVRKRGEAILLPLGSKLISKNGRANFAMLGNGNLVLYCVKDRKMLWSSGTAGSEVYKGLFIKVWTKRSFFWRSLFLPKIRGDWVIGFTRMQLEFKKYGLAVDFTVIYFNI